MDYRINRHRVIKAEVFKSFMTKNRIIETSRSTQKDTVVIITIPAVGDRFCSSKNFSVQNTCMQIVFQILYCMTTDAVIIKM